VSTNVKNNWLGILLLVFLAGMILRVYGIRVQPPTSDDLNVAISAKNFVETGHLGPTMWNHPDLRNLLVYASMHLFGGGAIGLKLWSLAFGGLSVLLTGLVARELTGDDRVGALAALLLRSIPFTSTFPARRSMKSIWRSSPLPASTVVCSFAVGRTSSVSFWRVWRSVSESPPNGM